MHHMKTFTRTLVAALAMAAIAAPTSLARPIDLGTPKTQDPPAQSGSLPDPQDPVYWSYDYAAPRPQERSLSSGDHTPWVIVGLAVTGGCLLLGGVAMASRTHMRARRARIAA